VYIETSAGLLVILGCAHSGVVNTLRHIQRYTNESRIHAILGGLHLESASPARMNETIAALRDFAPERLGFCHCTGFAATTRLWNEFPERCFQAHAGLKMDFAK
ncbi:MAG: MBL fold metallo-hydrolase, partial [Verrucomicrobiota bacterium]